MSEEIRARHERRRPEPTGLGSPSAGPEQVGGTINIRRGLHEEDMSAAGLTVSEVRRRYADRFELEPHTQVFLNGEAIDDEERVVMAGDQLDFMPNAGEKGATVTRKRRTIPKIKSTDEITIKGDKASLATREGKVVTVPLAELLRALTPRRMDSCGVLLVNGVRQIESRGSTTVIVLERPPGRYPLRWIASQSPARFGSGTEYRNVAISLPYVLELAAFEDDVLSGFNECFFRGSPLSDNDEHNELLYPGLLNCSRFVPNEGKPLSWICTQKLDRSPLYAEQDRKARIRKGLVALNSCLFETGFNYSSEEHEYSSWYTESRSLDPRITTIEAWEKATEEDPLFALDVPWHKTGMTLGQVIDRMFTNQGVKEDVVASSMQLARMILNHS